MFRELGSLAVDAPRFEFAAWFADLCLIQGVPQAQTAILIGVNHKSVEHMAVALDEQRYLYVLRNEKNIVFGGESDWVDVEADEVDLAKYAPKFTEGSSPTNPVTWEQWCGVLQRGVPGSLVLFRLSPKRTSIRAPGPGPIRSKEWRPFAKTHLANRRVILHTDGARAYKWTLRGLMHDNVVHMKKSVMIKGTRVWRNPFYSKNFTHTLPDGSSITVRGGSQVIDRFWRTLRSALVGRSWRGESHAFERRIRSCQWNYWKKGQEQWIATGEMLTENRCILSR